MTVPLFQPSYDVPACLAQIELVLRSGWTAPGPTTEEFEERWKLYLGQLTSALFTSSATAGLHLALEVFKQQGEWQPGDEVLSTPLTFVSTNHVILHAGLRPVFVDVDNTGCLDPLLLQRAMTKRTRAVMFVGLGGNTGRIEAVHRFCEANGLVLIVDAAHMAGTRFRGGLWPADASVFSFQTVKNLPTADGGMLCFHHQGQPNIYDKARLAKSLAWMGIDKSTAERQMPGRYKWKYNVAHVGWKYAGNAVAAAIGLAQLAQLDHSNAYRRQLASWYNGSLDSTVWTVPLSSDCESSRHLYQVRVANRDALQGLLAHHHIETGVHYRYNGDYPMYRDQPECELARKLSGQLLSLPMHRGVSHEHVKTITRLLNAHNQENKLP